MMRTYGRYNRPENKDKCVVEVFEGWHSAQCSRKRGHGPGGEYCKQHAKIEEQRRLRQHKQSEPPNDIA